MAPHQSVKKTMARRNGFIFSLSPTTSGVPEKEQGIGLRFAHSFWNILTPARIPAKNIPILKRAQRKPMLLFALPGVLFKLSVSTPALPPLFQLPPRMKPARY